MDWAPRVKAAKIRRLYHSNRRGLCDEDVLLDVGWSLHARGESVVAAVTGLTLGEVPCPTCGETVQRPSVPAPTARQRAELFGGAQRLGWFHCEHCQSRLLWQDCRDALRKQPRCLKCYCRLRRAKTTVSCPCGLSWEIDKYRASVGRRVLLPCPKCNQRLRRPVFARHSPDRSAKKLPDERTFRCSKCGGMLTRSGAFVACRSCDNQVRWRSYKKSLKRREEALSCKGCGHQFRWQAWRREAGHCSTGNPTPVYEFLEQWPVCDTTQARMMQVDILVQALHGQGALAPVFIEGTKASIRQLLDELAAAP